MKALLDLEKDNLFDFFSKMDLLEFNDFIKKHSKNLEEKKVYNAIYNAILQIKQEKFLAKVNFSNEKK